MKMDDLLRALGRRGGRLPGQGPLLRRPHDADQRAAGLRADPPAAAKRRRLQGRHDPVHVPDVPVEPRRLPGPRERPSAPTSSCRSCTSRRCWASPSASTPRSSGSARSWFGGAGRWRRSGSNGRPRRRRAGHGEARRRATRRCPCRAEGPRCAAPRTRHEREHRRRTPWPRKSAFTCATAAATSPAWSTWRRSPAGPARTSRTSSSRRDYKFMCSSLGQQMIEDDIKKEGLDRRGRGRLLAAPAREDLPPRLPARRPESLPLPDDQPPRARLLGHRGQGGRPPRRPRPWSRPRPSGSSTSSRWSRCA